MALDAVSEDDADAALAHVREALEIDPKFAQAHVFLGIIHEGLDDPAARDDYRRAVGCYEELRARYPDDLELALDHCVALYLWRGQAEALHAVNEILSEYPEYQPAASLREHIENNRRSYFIHIMVPAAN